MIFLGATAFFIPCPEIGDAKFKAALWTLKQQLAFKYEYVVEFLLFS